MSVLRNPDARLRTVWRLGLFAIGLLACYAVGGLVTGLLFALVWPEGQDASMHMLLVSGILAGGLTLGWAAFLRRTLDRRPARSMGLGRPARRLAARPGLGLAAGAGVVALAVGGLGLADVFVHAEAPPAWPDAVGLLIMFLAAAFAEEIAFRGYVFQNFLDIRRPGWGIAVSALAFWLLHGANPHAWSSPWVPVNLALAGVVLAVVYWRAGNLWTAVTVHAGWNFAQVGLFGLPVSGIDLPYAGLVPLASAAEAPTVLSGGHFGLEGSVAATGALVALGLAYGLPLAYRRR